METPFTLAFKCLSRSLSPHRLPENDSLGYGDRVGLENCADPGFFQRGWRGFNLCTHHFTQLHVGFYFIDDMRSTRGKITLLRSQI